jgi:hypothetical protein
VPIHVALVGELVPAEVVTESVNESSSLIEPVPVRGRPEENAQSCRSTRYPAAEALYSMKPPSMEIDRRMGTSIERMLPAPVQSVAALDF